MNGLNPHVAENPRRDLIQRMLTIGRAIFLDTVCSLLVALKSDLGIGPLRPDSPAGPPITNHRHRRYSRLLNCIGGDVSARKSGDSIFANISRKELLQWAPSLPRSSSPKKVWTKSLGRPSVPPNSRWQPRKWVSK